MSPLVCFGRECSGAQHVCQNNSSKKMERSDISVKARLLKRHKAILLWKVKWEAVPFIILLMRVTNVLTARRSLVIGGKFFFLVRGLLLKSFQLPEETLMKEFCGMGGAMLLPLLWRLPLERPPPLCVIESLPPPRPCRIVSSAVSWFIGSSTSLKSWNLSHQPNHSAKWLF